MSDEIVIKAKSTTDIKNGSVIVSVQETGETAKNKIEPLVNQFVASGTMYSRYNTRFDDVRYYSGDTAN